MFYGYGVVHFDSCKLGHERLSSVYSLMHSNKDSNLENKILRSVKNLFEIIAYSVAIYTLYPIESGVHFIFNRPLAVIRKTAREVSLFQRHFPKGQDPYSKLIAKQVKADIQNYEEREGSIDDIRNNIKKFIKEESLFVGLKDEEVELRIEKALATYCSSKIHYSPVVLAWAKNALDHALERGQGKVLFMARDGSPAYEAALLLKKTYPSKYRELDINLFHISRKLANWAEASKENKQMYLDFIKQEKYFCEEGNDNCLFVDVGFFGSKNNFIRKLLSGLVDQIEFGFLISHSDDAVGFLADLDHPLYAIRGAATNPAAAWIEDTHQGVVNSTVGLFRDSQSVEIKRRIEVQNDPTCKASNPEIYLYKKFGRDAIIDGTQSIIKKTQIKEISLEKVKKTFDQYLLGYVHFNRFLLIDHF